MVEEKQHSHTCIICGSDNFERRFCGNNLCTKHWKELLEDSPDNPIHWIKDKYKSCNDSKQRKN